MSAFQKYCDSHDRPASDVSSSPRSQRRTLGTSGAGAAVQTAAAVAVGGYIPHVIIRKAADPPPPSSPSLAPSVAPSLASTRGNMAPEKGYEDDDDERSFTMHSGEVALAQFRGQPVGMSTAEAVAQSENERISNPRLSLGNLTRALAGLFLPKYKTYAAGGDENEDVENPEDFAAVTKGSASRLVDIAKWLLGKHSSTGFLDVCEWMAMIKSGDIQRAEATVQQDPVAAYTQADRKRGTFRPRKGHMRPFSASISPRRPAYANVPKIVRARKKKAEILSARDLRRIRNYVLHRGRLLGLSDRARLEAANEAVERARGGGAGFADYGAAVRRRCVMADGVDACNVGDGWDSGGSGADRGGGRGGRASGLGSPNRRRRRLRSVGGRSRSRRRGRRGAEEEAGDDDDDDDDTDGDASNEVGQGEAAAAATAAAKDKKKKHHSLNFYTVDDYHDLTDSHHSRVFVKMSSAGSQ